MSKSTANNTSQSEIVSFTTSCSVSRGLGGQVYKNKWRQLYFNVKGLKMSYIPTSFYCQGSNPLQTIAQTLPLSPPSTENVTSLRRTSAMTLTDRVHSIAGSDPSETHEDDSIKIGRTEMIKFLNFTDKTWNPSCSIQTSKSRGKTSTQTSLPASTNDALVHCKLQYWLIHRQIKETKVMRHLPSEKPMSWVFVSAEWPGLRGCEGVRRVRGLWELVPLGLCPVR